MLAHTNKQTNRHTDRQTDKQTKKQFLHLYNISIDKVHGVRVT